MTLNNMIKIQPTERILMTPSAAAGAAVAFCEIRGDATTPNETLLVKSGSNGTGSALLIRNLAGQNLFSFKSNGDFDLNQSNLSTGDFSWRGQTDNNAVFFDASSNNAGFGLNNPSERVHSIAKVRADEAFNVNGTDGIGGAGGTTYTFGGGGSGDVADITVRGGIITAISLVP